MVEKLCYLDDTIRARRDAFDSVIIRIRSGWSTFKDLKPLLASRGLSLGAEDRLYSACGHNIMLY